jgi:hypothetical protein
MNIVFSGPTRCSFCYMLISVMGGIDCDFDAVFSGQNNGICGTAVHGQIGLVFGPHTDTVHLTIAITDGYPALDNAWSEIVESPLFADEDLDLFMRTYDRDPKGSPIHLPAGNYRVRYSALNFSDSSYDIDPTQRYELIIWPDDEFEPDKVIKVTHPSAKMHHHPVI